MRAWEAAPTLHDLLARSDFVSVHCPLNEHTRGLIDADALRAMKPTAYLVNTARGGVINQAALVDALRANVIAGAGLDVQDPEPPEPDSPLWGLENATLSPHVGWKRVETRQRLMDAVAENARRRGSTGQRRRRTGEETLDGTGPIGRASERVEAGERAERAERTETRTVPARGEEDFRREKKCFRIMNDDARTNVTRDGTSRVEPRR